jgi:hypothetical protein
MSIGVAAGDVGEMLLHCFFTAFAKYLRAATLVEHQALANESLHTDNVARLPEAVTAVREIAHVARHGEDGLSHIVLNLLGFASCDPRGRGAPSAIAILPAFNGGVIGIMLRRRSF